MVPIESVQSSVLTVLLADPTITGTVGPEVHEADYQGVTFVYPGLRVDMGTQAPIISNCLDGLSFIVQCYSENDSSKQCSQLAYMAYTALVGKELIGAAFGSTPVVWRNTVPPFRTAPRIWRSDVTFTVKVYKTGSP